MKLVNVLDLGVQVELLADDCLAIADALERIRRQPDSATNHPHVSSLQTAFESLAILAAVDTNMDGNTPAREWREKTRRVWGAINTASLEHERVTTEP
jgi:hypothetical protein